MVEVTSEADAFGAAEAMADVIQLEKFARGYGAARSCRELRKEWMVARYCRGGRHNCTKCGRICEGWSRHSSHIGAFLCKAG